MQIRVHYFKRTGTLGIEGDTGLDWFRKTFPLLMWKKMESPYWKLFDAVKIQLSNAQVILTSTTQIPHLDCTRNE